MVIITGATGGIGKHLTKNVISNGFACCAIVRDVEKATNTFSDNNSQRLLITDYQFDSFAALLSSHSQQAHSVTLVLNAFDITPIKPAIKLSKEEISSNIEFNIAKQIEVVNKAWEFSRLINMPIRIVSLDSGAAYRPISGWGLYCSGKAYISMFLRVFSQENNVPVVLYDPGVVDTKMQETIRESSKEDFPLVNQFQDYYASDSLNSPDDVARDIFERYIANWTAVELCERYSGKPQ